MKKYVIGILAICALLFGIYFVLEKNFSDRALAEEYFTKASEGLPESQ